MQRWKPPVTTPAFPPDRVPAGALRPENRRVERAAVDRTAAAREGPAGRREVLVRAGLRLRDAVHARWARPSRSATPCSPRSRPHVRFDLPRAIAATYQLHYAHVPGAALDDFPADFFAMGSVFGACHERREPGDRSSGHRLEPPRTGSRSPPGCSRRVRRGPSTSCPWSVPVPSHPACQRLW